MEVQQHYTELVSMFTHPVFLVKDGIIIAVNKSAQELKFQINTSVFDIIASGQDAYQELTQGSISLTVETGPINTVAAVVRTGELDYFHLNCVGDNTELRALALASQILRDPLTNIVALTESIIAQDTADLPPKERTRIGLYHQNIHRLLRIVGNMSDTYCYTERMHHPEALNLPDVISDAVRSAQQLFNDATIRLTCHADSSSIIGLADQNLLDRAVYNMLSNAVHFSDPGSKILATLNCSRQSIRFTVENDCADFSPELLRTIFFRYRRVPSYANGRSGLGLGIPMIQTIASIHKGSLLVTVPSPGKVRFCLSFPVRQDHNGTLRSPMPRFDYAGGFDHALLELSDVLPGDAFE